jgi:hypothetical protein
MGIVKFFFFTGGTPAETRSGVVNFSHATCPRAFRKWDHHQDSYRWARAVVFTWLRRMLIIWSATRYNERRSFCGCTLVG